MATVASVKKGLDTADNDQFVRCYWEVLDERNRWYLFPKGGGYRKWYGYNVYVVDWEEHGLRIKKIGKGTPRNEQYYGRMGLTYTEFGRGSLGVRILPEGAIFNTSSPGIFCEASIRTALMGLLNSRTTSYMLRSMQPGTQHLGEGYLSALPALTFDDSLYLLIRHLVEEGVRLKYELISAEPTEREFTIVSLEHYGAHPKPYCSRAFETNTHACQALLHTLEGINDRCICDFYTLEADDVQAVLDETGTPAGWHPLIAGYDTLPEPPKGIDLPEMLPTRMAEHPRLHFSLKELARIKDRLRILYQAGPGAKVEDDPDDNGNGEAEALGGRIPIPAETFLEELSQKLEIHPISVYWLLKEMREQEGLVCPPELKRHMEDYASVSIIRMLGYRWPEQDKYEAEHGPILDPDLVDGDGIIPLVSCGGEPTAEERVRTRLERDFGEEGAERSLKEFRQWVGRDLGDWLRREFFKRHVQQFKQRPIAWHLVSPERTFEAFVLYHRLSRETLQRLRVQYAGNLIERLRADQERARTRGDSSRVTEFQFQIEDVEEFRSRIEKIERGDELRYRIRCRWKGEEETGRPGPYAPDLDDGVKVNIRPFQEAGLLAVKQAIKKW